jgi:peptidoglycan/xylan/chitin deacetylase (PgdA/CDA1 family)
MTRRVTLTFDNGPTPGVTEHVLDELAKRNVKATFFVIGRRLQAPGARDLSRRAVAEGHWVGNHTLTHSVQFGESTPEFAIGEIEGAQELIGELSHPDKLFRPYGGGGVLSPMVFNSAAVAHLKAEAFTCVLWSSVPRDWENPTGWVETAMADIAEQEWSVVVVHDEGHGSMQQLPRFLDALVEADVEIRQDFPDSVVPVRRGEQSTSLDPLTVDAAVQG